MDGPPAAARTAQGGGRRRGAHRDGKESRPPAGAAAIGGPERESPRFLSEAGAFGTLLAAGKPL